MKLISMTDFVLEQNKNTETLKNNFVNCANYANFLKQPLELWMFVPCDENGNVLEIPNCNLDIRMDEFKKYQQAKERCLFEGFEFISADDDYPFDLVNVEGKITLLLNKFKELYIEDLVKYNLQLTQTAIKQLSL